MVLHRIMERQEAHIWLFQLDDCPLREEDLRAFLSADDVQRLQEISRLKARRCYLVCRAVLRRILALYTGEPPQCLRLTPGPYGKPGLASDSAWEFNLSHSSDYALIGVSYGAAIGVDIERFRPVAYADRIVERYFANSLQNAYRRASGTDQMDLFFSEWTRLEATQKMLGNGLGGFRGWERDCRHNPYSERVWSPVAGYSATVVVDRSEAQFVDIADAAPHLLDAVLRGPA